MSAHDRPTGTLFVVGLGPGSPGLLTPAATAALEAAETVVGYRGYLESIAPLIQGKSVVERELGQEVERAREALDLAESGKTVALVSSGDAGIYGMGGVVWELASTNGGSAEIVMVPGVTAACSVACKLGAPLAHDWASISLSDLLTPWEVILRRVEAAALGDFVLVLYNPASRTRSRQLAAVAEKLLLFRSPDTPVGLVENAFRPSERVEIVTLLDVALGKPKVNMFTTVVIGSSRTYVARGKMVTPRIYAAKAGVGEGGLVPRPAPVSSDAGEVIMAESLAIIERELGSEPSDPDERSVVRRVIHASADFEYARTLQFAPGAIDAAVRALQGDMHVDLWEPAVILTDVEMLRAGIRNDLAEPLGATTVCLLNDPETNSLAAEECITRSAAGIRRAAAVLRTRRTIVAIGNAPTALEETLRLIRDWSWQPACVIGIPVGFVGVEPAKERLREECLIRGIPWITSQGRKGGTAVTAAVVNALLHLAETKPRIRLSTDA